MESVTSSAVAIECADHLNLSVRNLKESIDFYSRLFGTDGEIKDGGNADGVQWCIIGIPGKFYFCMYEMRDAKYDPRALQINHIGFYVPDFEETCRRIERLGIPIQYGGKPVKWDHHRGTSRSVYVVDPTGYTIEFAERLGAGLD